MAVSPRSELRIVSVTQFSHEGDSNTPGTPWEFEQQDVNCEVALRGGGFATMEEAVDSFFEQVEYDPTIADDDDTKAHFSEPIHVGDERYDIREYAYGAPKPYRVNA